MSWLSKKIETFHKMRDLKRLRNKIWSIIEQSGFEQEIEQMLARIVEKAERKGTKQLLLALTEGRIKLSEIEQMILEMIK
jgi:hypothetical protein